MTKRKIKGPAQAKQKKKAWGSKQVLASPFAPVMPAATPSSREAVLRVLLEVIPTPFAKREARPSRKSLTAQPVSGSVTAAPVKQAPPRKSCKKPAGLLAGLNEVTRGLERGEVSLVVVARDVTPALLVAHIPVLCFVCGAALVVMPGDGTDVGEVLGTRRVLALGVRKMGEGEMGHGEDVAGRLLEGLNPLATRLDYPWLAAAKRKGKEGGLRFPELRMVAHRSKMDIG